MWALHPVNQRQGHTKILVTARHPHDWWDEFIDNDPNAKQYAAWVHELPVLASVQDDAREVVEQMAAELTDEPFTINFFAETEGNALDLSLTALMAVDRTAAQAVISHIVDNEVALLAELNPDIKLAEIAIGLSIVVTHTSLDAKLHASSIFFGGRGSDIHGRLSAVYNPSAAGAPLTLRGEILHRAIAHRPDLLSVLLDLVPDMRFAFLDLVSRVSTKDDSAWNATVVELSNHFATLAPIAFEVAAQGASRVGDITLQALRRFPQPSVAAELVRHVPLSFLMSSEMTHVSHELCTQALRHAQEEHDKPLGSVCWRYLSMLSDISGRYEEAGDFARKALDVIAALTWTSCSAQSQ